VREVGEGLKPSSGGGLFIASPLKGICSERGKKVEDGGIKI
jgi:hypothetical protein